MIVSCPSCKTKYQFEESRFGESGTKRLKCTKCETVFEISKPEIEESEIRRTAVAPPAGKGRTTGDPHGPQAAGRPRAGP